MAGSVPSGSTVVNGAHWYTLQISTSAGGSAALIHVATHDDVARATSAFGTGNDTSRPDGRTCFDGGLSGRLQLRRHENNC